MGRYRVVIPIHLGGGRFANPGDVYECDDADARRLADGLRPLTPAPAPVPPVEVPAEDEPRPARRSRKAAVEVPAIAPEQPESPEAA